MPGQFGFSDDPVTDATMHNADVARLRAMGLNPDGSPAKQGPYQSAHTTTDWHGGLLGQEIGRSTPFMQQNDRNEQLSAASRAQQIQSLGLARAQAMGTAPSAAGLGQQMALGQGANQMRAGMSGGNMLAMRGALGGGYGQMGQAVDQAGQARGQEQAQGLGMYGQGANALGQSDVNQMGLAHSHMEIVELVDVYPVIYIEELRIIRAARAGAYLNLVESSFWAKTYFAPRPASEKLHTDKLDLRGLNMMRPWHVALAEYVKENPEFFKV